MIRNMGKTHTYLQGLLRELKKNRLLSEHLNSWTTTKKHLAPMAIEKNQNPWGRFGATS